EFPDAGDGLGPWRFRAIARGSSLVAAIPPAVDDLTADARNGDLIHVCFTQVGINGASVVGYDIRYRLGSTMGDGEFAMAAAAPSVTATPPGTQSCFDLTQHDGIQAQRTFTIGIRAVGDCMQMSDLRTATVTTPRQKFATIEGCFIATAAYGSDLEP